MAVVAAEAAVEYFARFDLLALLLAEGQQQEPASPFVLIDPSHTESHNEQPM